MNKLINILNNLGVSKILKLIIVYLLLDSFVNFLKGNLNKLHKTVKNHKFLNILISIFCIIIRIIPLYIIKHYNLLGINIGNINFYFLALGISFDEIKNIYNYLLRI